MIPGTTVPAALVGVWDGAVVWVDQATGGRIRVVVRAWERWTDLDRVHLDLTHRPTRLEVMARLGARAGADVGEGVLWFRMFARRTWMIDGVAGVSATWSCDDDGAASLLPALADLDPTDDTRLPDGARVVDVRALAIVCQHVFGGAA